jgi:hypothetical protein
MKIWNNRQMPVGTLHNIQITQNKHMSTLIAIAIDFAINQIIHIFGKRVQN